MKFWNKHLNWQEYYYIKGQMHLHGDVGIDHVYAIVLSQG